jgi:hypothetical protein
MFGHTLKNININAMGIYNDTDFSYLLKPIHKMKHYVRTNFSLNGVYITLTNFTILTNNINTTVIPHPTLLFHNLRNTKSQKHLL